MTAGSPLFDRLGGLDAINALTESIVEVESPETGTPLPDTYQVAPPLT